MTDTVEFVVYADRYNNDNTKFEINGYMYSHIEGNMINSFTIEYQVKSKKCPVAIRGSFEYYDEDGNLCLFETNDIDVFMAEIKSRTYHTFWFVHNPKAKYDDDDFTASYYATYDYSKLSNTTGLKFIKLVC